MYLHASLSELFHVALDQESIYGEFSHDFQLLIKVETCWIRNIDICDWVSESRARRDLWSIYTIPIDLCNWTISGFPVMLHGTVDVDQNGWSVEIN